MTAALSYLWLLFQIKFQAWVGRAESNRQGGGTYTASHDDKTPQRLSR
jgi:hypothetical protein